MTSENGKYYSPHQCTLCPRIGWFQRDVCGTCFNTHKPYWDQTDMARFRPRDDSGKFVKPTKPVRVKKPPPEPRRCQGTCACGHVGLQKLPDVCGKCIKEMRKLGLVARNPTAKRRVPALVEPQSKEGSAQHV